MIIDSLAHIGRYLGIHPNLDTAIRFLLETDLHGLADGRHAISGDDVFVNISPANLSDNPTWEKHRLYADIQIALSEGESIAWAPEEDLRGFDEYDTKRGDIQLGQDPSVGVVMPLSVGQFCLYFPADAHRPGLGRGTTRKAVVKVKVC